ncbi:FecR protein [Anaerohalosphaera lusitana]|uniref:FecR protein n=1 Tax=Anaerohalosphaera lusitana TaxID=1936003 RepID=A0A1U9NJT3_9BACT|nr:FecR domain-containing protein [Anaerohalosphaera lusitana]AQT68075.1 FecR protein [Anaerohalosphaera lusitana]
MERKDLYCLVELVMLKLDDNLNEAGCRELNKMLREPQARQAYLEVMDICGVLKQDTRADSHLKDDAGIDFEPAVDGWWEALARYERTAPIVETQSCEQKKAPQPPATCVSNTERTISKLAIWVAGVSTAVLIALMALVFFGPATDENGEILATVHNHSGRAYDTNGDSLRLGQQLTKEWVNLEEGYLNLEMQCGASVLVQAPASFELEEPSQLFLHTGRLSSIVSKKATGFTVRTRNATVVDYGTEFGVIAYEDGEAEAHVFKGEVSLRVGSDPHDFERYMNLKGGQAGKTVSGGRSLKSVRAQPNLFVRSLPLETRFALPGRKIDLADIVGGGNGFGTGQQDIVIDPGTGGLTGQYKFKNREPSVDYSPVPELSLVDGVFVPDGGTGPVLVSQQEHIFENAPDTGGTYFQNISNGFELGTEGYYQRRDIVAGVKYGTESEPAISMHSNAGITFDLDAIRRSVPGKKLSRFTSLYGIAGLPHETKGARAAFYVLVDGEQKFKAEGKHEDLAKGNISVALEDDDQFLTLITCDADGNKGNDWCVFALPAIELE